MSLEEALAENTAALKALTVAMTTAGSPFPQPGDKASPLAGGTATGEPPKRGPGRPTKAEKEAADAAAAGQKIAETGDPVGTKYYENAQHKTVFSVKPGEKLDPALGGTEITAADFVAKRTALAQPATQPAATVAGAADPFAITNTPVAGADPFAMDSTPPAAPKTLQDCVNILKEIDTKHGRAMLSKALADQGAQNVGGLQTKDHTAVYAAFKTLLDLPKAA